MIKRLFTIFLCITVNSVIIFGITLDDIIKEADRLQSLGNFDKALSLFKQAELQCRNTLGEFNSSMHYILGSEASCAQQLDDYECFAQSLIKIDKICAKIGYEDDLTEVFLCSEIASFYLNTGTSAQDVAQALPYIERATKRSQLDNDRESLNICEYLNYRAKYILASYEIDLDKAADSLNESFSYFLTPKYLDENDVAADIIDCGLVLSANLMDRNQNHKSLEVLNQVESAIADIASHPRYIEIQSGKLYALSNLTRAKDCIALGESLLKSFQETSENFQIISAVKYNLGRAYSQQEEYLKALQCLNSIYQSAYSYQLEGVNTDYILSEIACCHLYLENYKEAERICSEIIKRNPTGSTLLAVNWVMGALANIKSDNLELSYIEDFISAYDTLGYEDLFYADSFLTFAKRYEQFFQYSKALQLSKRAVEMYEKIGDFNDPNYYLALLKTVTMSARLEDLDSFTRSFNCFSKHTDSWTSILRDAVKEKNYEFSSSFIESACEPMYLSFALSNFYLRRADKNNEINEVQKAQAYDMLRNVQIQLLQLVDIDEDLISWMQTKNPDRLGRLYGYIAMTYRDLREFDKEIECIDKGLELINESCEMHDLLSELKSFAIVQSSNYDTMYEFLNQKFQSDRECLMGLVNSFSKENRAEMWKVYYNNVSNYIEYAVQGNLGWLNALAYNSILLSKGLLLQSEVDFISRVRNSNDTALINKYNAYVNHYHNNELTEAKKLEHEILRNLNNTYESDLFKIDWKDVKNSLKDNEYAIEFRGYNDDCGDLKYYAFLINNSSENPKLIDICTEQDLINCRNETSYDFQNLYTLIWAKFEDIIPHSATVYFSPDFQLHSIPLEYLPEIKNANNPNSESWNLYRLTSTRELINRSEKSATPKNLNIFGGFNYTVGSDKLIADYKILESQTRAIDSTDNYSLRGVLATVNDLPGSKMEVEAISDILHRNNIVHKNYTGSNGTESSFKVFAKNGNVIHLSTHGFYYTPEEMQRGNKISHILSRIGNIENQYDKILNYSGLMMAGVNDILLGKISPSLCDDGILTSQEISQLDLSSVDFAILSACETGIGTVNGDGVFGLQRGWKMAGVKKIMMSLWMVDDNATESLMVDFYKNWVSGMSLHEALKTARNNIRNTQGWESPQYWAGFVLLDCI